VDIKGHHEAGQSPQIKHKLESESDLAGKQLTKEQIEESLRNAEENRTKILDIKKEKAGQEMERVSEAHERLETKRTELEQKIKDDIQTHDEHREKHLEEVRTQAAAEVAHAKEVAARVRSEKENS